jgi:hypothetical protein
MDCGYGGEHGDAGDGSTEHHPADPEVPRCAHGFLVGTRANPVESGGKGEIRRKLRHPAESEVSATGEVGVRTEPEPAWV